MFLLSGFLPPLLSHFFFRSKYHLNTIKMRLSPGKMSRFFNFSLSVLIFIRRYQKQQKLSPFRCWKKSLGTAFFSNPLFFSTFFIFHPFVLWYLKGQNTYFPPPSVMVGFCPKDPDMIFYVLYRWENLFCQYDPIPMNATKNTARQNVKKWGKIGHFKG